MRGRFRLTRAGGGAIVIAILMLAAGLLKTINLLILLGDLLLILIVINAVIAWRMSRTIRVVRVLPADHFAGEPTARTLEVTNDSPRSSLMGIRDESTIHREAMLESIGGGHTTQIRMPFTPERRGVFTVTTSLGSGYPFGFVRHTRSGPAREPLIVFPALGVLDVDSFRRWIQRAGAGDARTRRPTQQVAAAHADLRGVRPYRSGDSPRHIHWRTSARRNELMVREYDSPDALDLVMVVEATLPSHSYHEQRKAFEASISLAATILNAWCRGEQSPRVRLITDTEPIEGRASPALARRLFTALAHIRGSEEQVLSVPAHWAQSRAIRLFVGTSPLPAVLGPGWQRLSPVTAPAWYHPPAKNKASRKR